MQHLLNEAFRLCYAVIGRDIFKKEIGIVDGHDCSSYFWIRPVKIVDPSDTNGIDNVAEMPSVVRDKWPHSPYLHDTFVSIHHCQFIDTHKIMTKFLVVHVVALGRTPGLTRIVHIYMINIMHNVTEKNLWKKQLK